MISRFANVGLQLLDGLRDHILGLWKSGIPSYPSMNVDGWKTDEKFFESDNAAVQGLRRELSRLMLGLNFDGWAMVNTQGCQHPRHQHTNVLLSGVYYVDPGDPPTSTVFDDIGLPYAPIVHPGVFITFPEGVWHQVPVYRGTRPRITIVINAKKELNR